MTEIISDQKLQDGTFYPLSGVSTVTAVDPEDIFKYVVENAKRDTPRLSKLETFRKVKGHDKSIALVGGGPSLKDHIKNIKGHDVIIAAGSSYDYMMREGVIPDYCMVCDPDTLVMNYMSILNKDVKYLIASGCHPDVFDYLKDYQVYMWHCHSDNMSERLLGIEKNYEGVGGGCTVGLRAISVAILFGYTNIHFYGYDSCLGVDDAHHAYEFSTAKEVEDLGQIYKLKVGILETGPEEDAKVFSCAGYHLAQAEHFKQFYTNYGACFTPTFHGDGLLHALYSVLISQKEVTK